MIHNKVNERLIMLKKIVFLPLLIASYHEALATSLETNPNWCRGLAMMAGQDPQEAALDCLWQERLKNPDPLTMNDYQQYQSEKALRDQTKALHELNKTLEHIEWQQRLKAWCDNNPGSGGCH